MISPASLKLPPTRGSRGSRESYRVRSYRDARWADGVGEGKARWKGYKDQVVESAGGWELALVNPHAIHIAHRYEAYLPKAFQMAKAFEAGAAPPPVLVSRDSRSGGAWVCNDGAHRVTAMRMVDRPILVRRRAPRAGPGPPGPPPHGAADGAPSDGAP